MYGVILGIHIVVSLGLIVTVLLQSGKGGGLAGAFGGGGGAGAVFGGQTAVTILGKATRYLAIIFMVTSLTMAFVVRTRGTSAVIEGLERREATPATNTTGEPIPSEGLPEGLPQPVVPDQDGATEAPAGDNPVVNETTDE
ncbi:preprotein translocase subunit SecG [bacterium]|nr:preprotein translocase subunit SecG [bacterium]